MNNLQQNITTNRISIKRYNFSLLQKNNVSAVVQHSQTNDLGGGGRGVLSLCHLYLPQWTLISFTLDLNLV